MKKMFYKRIKILVFFLLSFFAFQQTVLCDYMQEAAFISNLANAKSERQKKNASFKLLKYYMYNKDYESAVTMGNKILNFKLSKKQKYNVYYSLANSYSFLKKTEKALEQGREAQYLYPKKIETKLLLGKIYIDNSLNELAISQFKEVLDVDDDNFEALISLANIYNFQKSYKLSLELFEKAEKEAGQNNKELSIDDHVNMAISAKEIGRREQAQTILEKIENKNKTSALLLVSIYQSKQEFDKAIETLLPFVYHDETDIEIYCNLAQLYLLSNQFEKAKDLLIYFKSKNNQNIEAIDLLLIEAYHNIHHSKERELKELNKILKYTNSDYLKSIIEKIIIFEKIK